MGAEWIMTTLYHAEWRAGEYGVWIYWYICMLLLMLMACELDIDGVIFCAVLLCGCLVQVERRCGFLVCFEVNHKGGWEDGGIE